MKAYILLILALILALLFSCEQEEVNPFDELLDENPLDTNQVVLDPTSFAGLHANIFSTVCANSGCHDGTFEPDFRTLESAYNTLVYQPIIKNDPAGTYTYRVLPGNKDLSVLYARLTFDIDGFSGIMPLVIEPDSDWNEKQDEHIQNIATWIDQGAKDVFGNSPGQANPKPQMAGAAAQVNASWLDREEGGSGALKVSAGTSNMTLYVSLTDDSTPPASFGTNKIKFSTARDSFEIATERNLDIISTPVIYTNFFGQSGEYYHKISFDPMDFGAVGETVFFRVYVTDNQNPVTEIPADGGAAYIKKYFSYTIVP